MTALEIVFLVTTCVMSTYAVITRTRLRFSLRRERHLIAENDRLRAGVPRTSRTQQMMRTMVETAGRLREGGVTGLIASSLEELTRSMGEDRAAIQQIAAPDGSVTIFFSDIEDSTPLNERLGDRGWLRVLKAHNAVLEKQIALHRGHVVKTQGDSFMVVFREPAQAAAAALGIQAKLRSDVRGLRAHPIRVRIGLHWGEVISHDGDYFGRNVALAARVTAMASGGETLVTVNVRDALVDRQDMTLTDVGEFELKGLNGQHALWSLQPVEDE